MPEPIPGRGQEAAALETDFGGTVRAFPAHEVSRPETFFTRGCETVIPLLDRLIDGAALRGVNEIVFGMAHRGA
jgi:hypothetical protein